MSELDAVFNINFSTIQDLLVEAQTIIQSLRTNLVPQEAAFNFNREITKQSIMDTIALQGNDLSREAMEKIFLEHKNSSPLSKSEKQISNLKNVYGYINIQDFYGRFLVTEELLKKLHHMMTESCSDERNVLGEYRAYSVNIGDPFHGGIYTPPEEHHDIVKLMAEFVNFINSEETLKLAPGLRAILAHYYLCLIHPFGDGNGRLARLVENILLRSVGAQYASDMICEYYYKNANDYFQAISNAEKNRSRDLTPFVEFALKGLVVSLKNTQEKIAKLK